MNELKSELLRQLRSTLGDPFFGPDDDFFDAGADSVFLVRLASRMKTEAGLKLPLAALYQCRTVHSLVSFIETTQQEHDDPVLIKMNHHDGERRFFCIHGAGGEVFNFEPLAKAADEHFAFYALRANEDWESNPVYESIDSMATFYWQEIKKTQPKGPYYLGGYSAGGVVAAAIARKMIDVKAEVGHLVLLDSYLPGHFPGSALFMQKLVWQTRLLCSLPVDMRKEHFNLLITRKWRDLCNRLGLEVKHAEPRELMNHIINIKQGYSIEPLSCSVTLIKATENMLYPDNGWAQVIKHLDVINVKSDHAGLPTRDHAIQAVVQAVVVHMK